MDRHSSPPRPLPRPSSPRGRGGFTLVELMIVIAILLFLMTIAGVAFSGLFTRAQATRTIQAITVTVDVLERFREEFPERTLDEDTVERGFPVKENWNNFEVADHEISAMTDGEWLRLLLAPTAEELEYLEEAGITRNVAEMVDDGQNVLSRFINDNELSVRIGESSREIQPGMAITDGWQRPLYYRFPGLSHVAQRNYMHMSGQNNLMLGVPDIWSAGADGESEYGEYGGERPEQGVITEWTERVNHPFRSYSEEYIDDIANWFPLDRY